MAGSSYWATSISKQGLCHQMAYVQGVNAFVHSGSPRPNSDLRCVIQVTEASIHATNSCLAPEMAGNDVQLISVTLQIGPSATGTALTLAHEPPTKQSVTVQYKSHANLFACLLRGHLGIFGCFSEYAYACAPVLRRRPRVFTR